MSAITKEQLERLKALNNRLYCSITGKTKEQIIGSFDEFLNEYQEFIQLNEELNLLADKNQRKEFHKQMVLKFSSEPENQDEAILEYLKLGNTITGVEALELFRCYRLSAVIHRLRHDRGLTIQNISKKKHAEYILIQE